MCFPSRRAFLAPIAIIVAIALIAMAMLFAKKDAAMVHDGEVVAKPVFRHPTAQIQITQADDPARGMSAWPLTAANGNVSGNLASQSASSGTEEKFSIVARYLCSTDDGDAYEIFWSEQGRLPPIPRSDDFPESSKIVKTGSGAKRVHESPKWTIDIVDSP